MPDQPFIIAVASYSSKATARQDLETVAAATGRRGFAEVATALLEKGADGQLAIDSHNITAKNLARGRALLYGVVSVIATPVGMRFFISTSASAGDSTRAAVIAGHCWNDIPRAQLHKMSDMLEAGQAALLVVAVEDDRKTIGACLTHANVKVVTECIWADLETDFSNATDQNETLD